MGSEAITVEDPSALDIRPGDLVYVRRGYSKLGRRIYITRVERETGGQSVWIFGHQVGTKSNIAKHDEVARCIMQGCTVQVLRRDSEATPGTKPGRELAAGDVVQIGVRKATITKVRPGELNISVYADFDDDRGTFIIVQPDQRIPLWKETPA